MSDQGEGFGGRREYRPGDLVVIRSGMVLGTILRRVSDTRWGVPRYSIRVLDTLRYRVADTSDLRPYRTSAGPDRNGGQPQVAPESDRRSDHD